jgi:hypothetical protein
VPKGACDVIVCDGFVGNVTLKLTESILEMMITLISKEIKKNPLAQIGALLCKPGVECPLSDVMEEKILGYSDEYPCLKEKDSGFAASLISQLKDPVKRELMHRKYILGQPDSTIREEMGLTLNQANIHHRWAKAQLRILVSRTSLV